jgi:DNA-binding winged helix-turn-helix (wHTH) protein
VLKQRSVVSLLWDVEIVTPSRAVVAMLARVSETKPRDGRRLRRVEMVMMSSWLGHLVVPVDGPTVKRSGAGTAPTRYQPGIGLFDSVAPWYHPDDVDVAVLGTLLVGSGATTPAPRDRAVLAALVVRAGAACSMDELAEVLWGGSPPASAPKVVQGCIARLRRLLGPDGIETSAAGYRLSAAVELDAVRFDTLLDQAREHHAAGLVGDAAATVAEALALWRGRPYAEIEGWPPA